jgi:hypothetical protein
MSAVNAVASLRLAAPWARSKGGLSMAVCHVVLAANDLSAIRPH